ncbi:TOMM precursor leader peptide-binding protein [Streptomyces tritici]|uniref:TOMM precursor leader peptide-binding protein n=1 Tax=Streptomyces tritici TaxID=2054410 RepID=UPI003AEFA098
MRPMLKPALRRAWRQREFVQFGATSAHAVVVGPVDLGMGGLLARMDGTRERELLEAEAKALGLPEGWFGRVLAGLADAGLLTDAERTGAGPGPRAGLRAGGPGAAGSGVGGAGVGGAGVGGAGVGGASRLADGALEPLRADLAALSVVERDPDGPIRRWGARAAQRVQVRGAGRVGAAVAALLSASGVGRVDVLDGGTVQPWEVTPGGLPAEAVGERRAVAAGRLVGRSAPGGRPPREVRGAGGGEPGTALVVVTPRDGLGAYVPDPVPAEPWVTGGVPHLYAGVLEATGVVGPLVLPGGTACAECLLRERTDREPTWPSMLAQWRSGAPDPAPACDASLAAAVAGLTAAHALAFLDGELPCSAGARWEVSLPLLEWREERYAPYPGCPCGAAGDGVGNAEGERRSGARRAQDTMAG